MTTLIANEVRKLRTIRGPWLLLAAGPVLIIVGVAGEVAGGADMTQPQTAIHAVAHAGVVSLLTLVFGDHGGGGRVPAQDHHRHLPGHPTPRPRDRRHRGLPRRVDPQPGRRHRHRPRLDRARRRADRRTPQRPRGVVPFAGGQALGRLPGAPDISQWAGGLLLAGYAVAFAAIALTTSVRLDIT
jgi:hypothetical protein